MFETRVVQANECYSLHQVMRHNTDIFSIFFNMKVCCVFSLESPHRGDSNEYTQYTIFSIEKKITLNYLKSAAMEFFFQAGLKNEFETAVVNEPSVFEPLKLYYTWKMAVHMVAADYVLGTGCLYWDLEFNP